VRLACAERDETAVARDQGGQDAIALT
jgi:hypothetical protein